MKNAICWILLIALFLCGCSRNEQSTQYEVGTFSYESDIAHYNKEDPGYNDSGFENTEKTKIKRVEQVVELAKNECRGGYDSIQVDYDSESKIYRVLFWTEGWEGGIVEVYINQDGITQLIVAGE